MLYSLTWEIDVDAESPEEAAQEARRIQMFSASSASVFKVQDEDGYEIVVDTNEE